MTGITLDGLESSARAGVGRIAHERLRFSERPPVYGDWTGWMPEVWWFEE